MEEKQFKLTETDMRLADFLGKTGGFSVKNRQWFLSDPKFKRVTKRRAKYVYSTTKKIIDLFDAGVSDKVLAKPLSEENGLLLSADELEPYLSNPEIRAEQRRYIEEIMKNNKHILDLFAEGDYIKKAKLQNHPQKEALLKKFWEERGYKYSLE